MRLPPTTAARRIFTAVLSNIGHGCDPQLCAEPTVSATLDRVKKPVSRVTDALEAIAERVDGRAARWTEHRVIRREELIDAAVEAVRQFGSEVGMDQIAATARTSKPVIYRYFTDKNDLYRAVGKRVVEQIVAALRSVPGDSDPQTLLRASIDAYLQLLEDNPQLFRFITQNRLLNEARIGKPTATEFSGPVADVLTTALGEQLGSIGLDPAGARPWGEAVVGFIRAASLWWLDHPETMTRAELREYLAALLWGGGAGLFQLAGVEVDARPRSGVFAPLT
jgi:AcrR family transcriptional regulator